MNACMYVCMNLHISAIRVLLQVAMCEGMLMLLLQMQRKWKYPLLTLDPTVSVSSRQLLVGWLLGGRVGGVGGWVSGLVDRLEGGLVDWLVDRLVGGWVGGLVGG